MSKWPWQWKARSVLQIQTRLWGNQGRHKHCRSRPGNTGNSVRRQEPGVPQGREAEVDKPRSQMIRTCASKIGQQRGGLRNEAAFVLNKCDRRKTNFRARHVTWGKEELGGMFILKYPSSKCFQVMFRQRGSPHLSPPNVMLLPERYIFKGGHVELSARSYPKPKNLSKSEA